MLKRVLQRPKVRPQCCVTCQIKFIWFEYQVTMCPRLCTSLGMTENTGCVALGDEHTAHLGEVGTPGPGVHIKLENWEEGGYRVSKTGW